MKRLIKVVLLIFSFSYLSAYAGFLNQSQPILDSIRDSIENNETNPEGFITKDDKYKVSISSRKLSDNAIPLSDTNYVIHLMRLTGPIEIGKEKNSYVPAPFTMRKMVNNKQEILNVYVVHFANIKNNDLKNYKLDKYNKIKIDDPFSPNKNKINLAILAKYMYTITIEKNSTLLNSYLSSNDTNNINEPSTDQITKI